jgi:type 1 glutamine amidotransferase
VVGIRTASHAFTPSKGESVADSKDSWPALDRDVLGGNYTGHHGNRGDRNDRTVVRPLEPAAEHPILTGVPDKEFASSSWLYKVSPLAPTATPLMTGHVKGTNQTEPIAWTNMAGESRVFYTSLGHPDDFQLPPFTRLLESGIRWAAKMPVETHP